MASLAFLRPGDLDGVVGMRDLGHWTVGTVCIWRHQRLITIQLLCLGALRFVSSKRHRRLEERAMLLVEAKRTAAKDVQAE